METLTEAMTRLRAAGYCADFDATDNGQLRCGICGARQEPHDMTVHETVRFEGDSNPDDEAILLALACSSGCLGQYSAAFGPGTPAADVEVLHRLAPPPAMTPSMQAPGPPAPQSSPASTKERANG